MIGSDGEDAVDMPAERRGWSLARLVGRVFRFRLLTLLAALTAVGIWLGFAFPRQPIEPHNVNRLRPLDEIERAVWQLEWSPDRKRVAFVGWEMPVDVRETITLWPVRTVGEGRKLIHFAFSPDRNCVAYCENTTLVELLHLKSGRTLALDTGNPQPAMVFSPDGKLVATGGYGREASLWDAKTGKLVRTLIADLHGAGGLEVQFSPDGKLIAVGNRNSIARLYDVDTGRQLHVLDKPNSHDIAFHPSSRTVAISYVDASIVLWDVATGQVRAEQQTPAEEIYTLDWSPQGDLLASGGLKGDICLWSEDLTLLRALPAPEWVISVKFSPDSSRLITAGGEPQPGGKRSVTVWGIGPSLTGK